MEHWEGWSARRSVFLSGVDGTMKKIASFHSASIHSRRQYKIGAYAGDFEVV
jgi:hypothetical protein